MKEIQKLQETLDVFYNHSIDTRTRTSLQAQLLSFISDPSGLQTSLSILQSLSDSNYRPGAYSPFLLHFAANVIEQWIRKRWDYVLSVLYQMDTVSSTDVIASSFFRDILLSAMVNCVRHNINSYVIQKLVVVAVEWAKRCWVSNQQGAAEIALQIVLNDNPDHSLHYLSLLVLCNLYMDMADKSRADLLTQHRKIIKDRLASLAPPVATALHQGLSFRDADTAALCARALERATMFGTKEESWVSIAALRNASIKLKSNPTNVSLAIATSLAELCRKGKFMTSSVPIQQSLVETLEHAYSLIQPMSTVDLMSRNEYFEQIVDYFEAIVAKSVTLMSSNQDLFNSLKKSLQLLYEFTIKPVHHKSFMQLLDVWKSIAEMLAESPDSNSSQIILDILQTGMSGITELCMKNSLFQFNRESLSLLEDWENEDEFHEENLDDEDYLECEDVEMSERNIYITKCTALVSEISNLYPLTIGSATVSFMTNTVSQDKTEPRDVLTILEMLLRVIYIIPVDEGTIQGFTNLFVKFINTYQGTKIPASCFMVLSELIFLHEQGVLEKDKLDNAAKSSIYMKRNRRESLEASRLLGKIYLKMKKCGGTSLFEKELLWSYEWPDVQAKLLLLAMRASLGKKENPQLEIFRSYLTEAMTPCSAAFAYIASNQTISANVDDTLIQGCSTLYMLFDQTSSEPAHVKMALSVVCEPLLREFMKIFPVMVFRKDGKVGYLLLRMVSRMLEAFRNIPNQIAVEIIQSTFNIISSVDIKDRQSEAYLKVCHGLLILLRTKLENVESVYDYGFIHSCVSLAQSFMNNVDSDPELRNCGNTVLAVILEEFWFNFFPQDHTKYLTSDHQQPVPIADPRDQALFYACLKGVISGLQVQDFNCIRSTIAMLEELNMKRRLYDRDFFRGDMLNGVLSLVIDALIKEENDSIKEDLQSILYGMSQKDLNGFKDHFLTEKFKSFQVLQADQVLILMSKFSLDSDYPSFARNCDELINDYRYFRSLNLPFQL